MDVGHCNRKTKYCVHPEVEQSLTCLATDVYLTADPRVASSIPVRSNTCVEMRKYVHEVLVNCLFKLVQEKVWLGELTVPP